MGLMKELNDLNAIYLKMHEQQVSENQDKGYVVTKADKKGNTKAWQGYKAGVKSKTTGKPLYRAADHLKNEELELESVGSAIDKGLGAVGDTAKVAGKAAVGGVKVASKVAKGTAKAAGRVAGTVVGVAKAAKKGFKSGADTNEDKDWGYDSKGNSLNPVDIEKKKKKDNDLAGAPNVKKEGFSNWRHDLKEIPDYEQIPLTDKKRNAKVEEKNVKNKIKINPEMAEETQVDEGVYEKQKTKEVMGALKKRDLKKDVKKKIAADIVKKKGDTSKSDDRYAYESKLWDEVAANLTELGELNDVRFKVEGYQRDPEGGEEKERKAKRERKGGYDEKRERRMNDPKKGINSPAFQEFMRSRGM